MTPGKPARIHLLPAREAPVVIVIRRKPSRVVHIMRWNAETDEVEHGSWFRGRLYELRSDVSPNGKWMVYLAMGSTGETWTGVCNPPWLKTAIDWPNCGTYHGGGLFRTDALLEANAGNSQNAMEAAARAQPELPLQLRPYRAWISYEDEGVLYPRLERDGWASFEGAPTQKPRWRGLLFKGGPAWRLRPTPDHPELQLFYHGYFRSGGLFQFEMPEVPGLIGPEVTWAAWDCLGQLVLAREGRLERYTLEALKRGEPVFSLDLEGLEPPERGHPAEPLSGDPIVVRRGELADQDVQVLMLPLLRRGAVRSQRLVELLDLAGPHLPAEFPDLESLGTGRPVATPAYFLRQHTLIHVPEPSSDRPLVELARCCRSAFREALERGHYVATWCIGLEAGWPVAVSAEETVRAARAFVADGSEDSRRVVLVAGSDEQEAALRAAMAG